MRWSVRVGACTAPPKGGGARGSHPGAPWERALACTHQRVRFPQPSSTVRGGGGIKQLGYQRHNRPRQRLCHPYRAGQPHDPRPQHADVRGGGAARARCGGAAVLWPLQRCVAAAQGVAQAGEPLQRARDAGVARHRTQRCQRVAGGTSSSARVSGKGASDGCIARRGGGAHPEAHHGCHGVTCTPFCPAPPPSTHIAPFQRGGVGSDALQPAERPAPRLASPLAHAFAVPAPLPATMGDTLAKQVYNEAFRRCLQVVEWNVVPDSAIRVGIRQLLGQRVKLVRRGGQGGNARGGGRRAGAATPPPLRAPRPIASPRARSPAVHPCHERGVSGAPPGVC